ncbi:MAG: hypothetical protein LUG83_02560, partial [Lachnospiraceae bacterium]|nr:hypothetical protein [Lachnospiraceae bacterium]
LYLKDRYPDISLFNYSSDMTLECLMRMGLAEFVDNSDKTCSFEQELFYRILRISAASEHTFLEDSANISFFYDIVNKRCLLEPTTLTIPESFLMFQTKVSLSSGNTGVLALKGIPSSDGQAGAWLDARGPRYAIPSNSSNKEGAWQFIEYVLLCDSGTVYESLYLPARTDELLNRLQNIRPQILGDDEISELPEWTEEYNESFYAIIENAYEDRTDDVIYEIILEEAQYYFNGVKTEQEVAKVIQNRIQLYLSE